MGAIVLFVAQFREGGGVISTFPDEETRIQNKQGQEPALVPPTSKAQILPVVCFSEAAVVPRGWWALEVRATQ